MRKESFDWSGIERVGIDTAPLIYYIEKHERYFAAVEPIFERVAKGGLTASISSLAIAELLVHPFQQGSDELARKYRRLLETSTGVSIQPVTVDVAVRAAELRGDYGIRTPDALHLASALDTNCDVFLTNDHQLDKIDELRIVLVDRLGGA